MYHVYDSPSMSAPIQRIEVPLPPRVPCRPVVDHYRRLLVDRSLKVRLMFDRISRLYLLYENVYHEWSVANPGTKTSDEALDISVSLRHLLSLFTLFDDIELMPQLVGEIVACKLTKLRITSNVRARLNSSIEHKAKRRRQKLKAARRWDEFYGKLIE